MFCCVAKLPSPRSQYHCWMTLPEVPKKLVGSPRQVGSGDQVKYTVGLSGTTTSFVMESEHMMPAESANTTSDTG